ncbi:13699_t:CDS:2, partial [Funneliformis mosseae]
LIKENHHQRQLLSAALDQVAQFFVENNRLYNELNNLSSRFSYRRHRYRELKTTYNNLQFQYNYMRSEVDRLQNLPDARRVQNLQRNAKQLRSNFNRLLVQLQQRSKNEGCRRHYACP